MVLSTKNIIDKGYGSLETEMGKYIFKLYFSGWKSQEDIREQLRKKRLKVFEEIKEKIAILRKDGKSEEALILEEKIRKKPKDKDLSEAVLRNVVSKYTKAWKELGYLTKKTHKELTEEGIKVSEPIDRNHTQYFFADLNPYFEYLKEKNKKLNKEQKEYLSSRFNEILREEVYESKENFFESIETTIKDFLILRYVKNLLFERLNQSVNFTEEILREERIIIQLIVNLCDKLTIKSISNYLRFYLTNIIIESKDYGDIPEHIANLIESLEEGNKTIFQKNVKIKFEEIMNPSSDFKKIFHKAIFYDITKEIVLIYRIIKEAKTENKINAVRNYYNLDLYSFSKGIPSHHT